MKKYFLIFLINVMDPEQNCTIHLNPDPHIWKFSEWIKTGFPISPVAKACFMRQEVKSIRCGRPSSTTMKM